MFELTIVIVCLGLNAVLSCIEMAFVTVSKPHLRTLAQQGDRAALRALKLKSNPERVLSVLQIGITLVGAISAAVGGAGAEETLSPWFQSQYQLSEELSETLAIVSIILPLTFFSVIFGELVPKALAIRFPIFFTRMGGYVLVALDKMFSPAVFILEFVTKNLINIFSKNFKSEPVLDGTGAVDLENLSDSHKQYVFNLISVDKRKVKDIALPWESVTIIDQDLHHTDVMQVIRDSRHTRLPVMNQNQPVGILYVKEFISEIEVAKMNWHELIRKPLFIKSDEPILNALKILQSKKSHMGLVMDRGQLWGIVTLEDIFEEVVGEIYDEDDNVESLLASNSRIRNLSISKN